MLRDHYGASKGAAGEASRDQIRPLDDVGDARSWRPAAGTLNKTNPPPGPGVVE